LIREPGCYGQQGDWSGQLSTVASLRRKQLIAWLASWTGLPSNARIAVCPRRGPGSLRSVRRDTRHKR
jgi:hypothetical protein